MDEIQDLPEHLRDALWRVESSGIRRFSASGLSVAVADGLSLGAGLLDPPAGDALLAISYSGEDAPVLAAFEAAKGPRFTLTTG
ncbi:MAG: hypothetical protein J2O48_06060, partial [Solirubrobacterales bacterium]|nr:hypothetical protein [Solirubrobacterales bacterium]